MLRGKATIRRTWPKREEAANLLEKIMKPLEIDKVKVLQSMQDFNTEDSERASDAGESRQRIGEFLEETGINNKAFSHCRMILRMKKDDKRQDWLRSMRALMPLMEEQIAAIGTRDAFDVPPAAKAAAQEEPDALPEEDNDGFPEDEEGEVETLMGDEAEAAAMEAEAKAFEQDAAKYEGNVKPFAAKKPGRKKAVAAE